MYRQKQSDSDLEKLADLIEESRIAMLTTAEVEIDEIEQHRRVNLSYVNADEHDYVSISGTAKLVRDRAKMRELWTPWVKPWFPRGLDDPDLVLLKVTIERAEYWDAPER